MNRSRSAGLALPAAVAIALVALLALMASGALGRTNDPSASPTPPPSASPSVPPSEEPSEEPSEAPSEEPGTNRVPLDIADDHDVVVIVDDETGKLVDVVPGRAGDGMSVRWKDAKVENVGASKLRLTWVGLPLDEEVELSVSESDGKLTISIDQRGPHDNTDALGYDRVLVLEFDEEISAEDVEVKISLHQA